MLTAQAIIKTGRPLNNAKEAKFIGRQSSGFIYMHSGRRNVFLYYPLYSAQRG
jgi:hypothetical protein